ncbi:MAG: multidrug effflux MFS transporter [Phenylobacterium sp.]
MLIAATGALGAFGIDAMLPNLPAIGGALGVEDENRRQLIITSYLLGLGGAQLFYGPLADRFGRRPVLFAGMGLYFGFSLLAAFSPNFEFLLVARALQGVGAAATQSVPMSIVRDRYEGREMARVTSLTSLVFMGAPIIAPSLGQLVLVYASWPWLFGLLAAMTLLLMVWAGLRMPETLRAEDRLPIRPREIAASFALAARNRTSMGYVTAQVCVFGSLLGFINSSQQIFAESFGAADMFPLVFAISAGFIAAASLLNARLVMQVGMRRLSHGALIGYVAISAFHLAVAATGHETLVRFALLHSLGLFCFGLSIGNFGAMAMEPMGHLAGVAAAFQGFLRMVGGSLIGFLIGQCFDGTVVPIEIGCVLFGSLALAAVFWAERGKLFQPHRDSDPDPVLAE